MPAFYKSLTTFGLLARPGAVHSGMPSRSTRTTPIGTVGSDRTNWIITAALFAPLVLLLIVAGMTWRAERRISAVTDRVVHDYAAIAVWQYARRANVALHDEVMKAFSGPAAPAHLRTSTSAAPELPATLLERRGTGSSKFHERARFAFNHDPATGRLDIAGDTGGARTVPMVRRRLEEVMRATRTNDEPHRVLFDSADGHSYALALWVVPGGEGHSSIVRGIAADAGALDHTFAEALRDPSLLPAVAGSTGSGRSGALALRLWRRDGYVVFETGDRLGATAATDTAGLQGGELRVTLDLAPRLAQELLIGGVPGSQLPSLGLMIVAAAILATVGLVHDTRSRALAQARSRFVANVSHELRTPLAQISMFAETLALGRERNEAERKHFARIVFAEARRLTALVENVLRFSRGASAGPTDVSLRTQPHRVAELVEAAVNAFAPIAAAAGAKVDTAIPGDLQFDVDSSTFQQVMLNLLDNAVKHGRGSRITVAATAEKNDLLVTVDDAGPGIPAEWRRRVFEPFTQVPGRNTTGAGIGLAIVRDLIDAHGGRVWIESSPLGGARVTLALPRRVTEPTNAAPLESRPGVA